jgi:hypothetical protein
MSSLCYIQLYIILLFLTILYCLYVSVDPDEFNDIIQKSFLAAARFDAGMYSHPLMLVRLLMDWRALNKSSGTDHRNERRVREWLEENNVVRSRIQQLDNTAKNIARTVGAVLKRIDRRIEARRVPKYDLSAWLAMQDDDLGSDSGSDASESSSLPFLPDDSSCDEDDNELAHEDGVSCELDSIALKVNLTHASAEEVTEAATRLNMCRLILAWSSDEMVLRQSLKRKMTADVMGTLRLGSNALSPAQCMSLFPPDVPHELKNSGSLMYDGEITGDVNLTDVLASMCNVGEFMADFRYGNSTSDLGWRSEVNFDVAPPVVWIVMKEENAIFIAISDRDLEDLIDSIFAPEKLADTGMEIGSYLVFAASNISKSEYKTLADFRNCGEFERVLSMTIPKTGHATLTATGCEPCRQDLQDIFCLPDLGPAKHNAQLPFGVKLQVKDQNQILTFEQASAESGQAYFFKDSLLKDIPIGMRLYTSYKNARFKDK